jgi:hypothetical protein
VRFPFTNGIMENRLRGILMEYLRLKIVTTLLPPR